MIEFDENGFIKPYEVIETDLATIEKIFVEEMPFSSTRKMIFDNYLAYNAELKQIIPTGFVQWIDGSFITKKRNPNDIDLVTFIDFGQYNANQKALEGLNQQMKLAKKRILDVYFVQIYAENHVRRNWYEIDKTQWLFEFSRTRNKQSKGFLQLNF
jgi:hypothetical protein